MTRDGTFRIRGGQIAEPLANLRFTVSVPEMLREVPGLTRRVALTNQNDFYGERYPFDEDFLAALAMMPPACGIALGLDRLVMLATGAARLDEVLWNPLA